MTQEEFRIVIQVLKSRYDFTRMSEEQKRNIIKTEGQTILNLLRKKRE